MPAIEWLGEMSAADYLAVDQARVRDGRAGAWAAELSDTAISVGVACRLPTAVVARATAAGWPILRRSTGGTALLHRPGDLAWSRLLPRDHPSVGRDYVRAYGRLGAPVVAGLANAGIAADWGDPVATSSVFCLFGPRGSVLRVGAAVLGGAAQRLTPRWLLHHGVLNGSVDRPELATLFDLPAQEVARKLTALEELPHTGTLTDLGRAVLREAAVP